MRSVFTLTIGLLLFGCAPPRATIRTATMPPVHDPSPNDGVWRMVSWGSYGENAMYAWLHIPTGRCYVAQWRGGLLEVDPEVCGRRTLPPDPVNR